jgi:hypothetical protein
MAREQMTFRGTVSGGVIVPEQGAALPDGTEVRIEVIESPSTTLGQRLLKFAGKAKGLPTDMARNHDHYLHGQPKR